MHVFATVITAFLLIALAAADCDPPCQNAGMCVNENTYSWCDCPYSFTGDHCESVLTTGDDCIRNCDGKADGLYQNCRRCTIFANCTGGHLEEGFCDEDTEWHESNKKCKAGNSGTCEMKVVSPNDVGPCAGENPCKNGGMCHNYEDLESYYCNCPYTYTGEHCDSVLTTGDDCVRDCEDKDDGKYKNCRRCTIYVNCTNGELEEGYCDEEEKWDNGENACVAESFNSTSDCELKIVDPPNTDPSSSNMVTSYLVISVGVVLLMIM